MSEETYATTLDFIGSFRAIQKECRDIADSKGWSTHFEADGTLIALMHSELSEALDALRHGNPPSGKIPEFSGAEEELADTIIRIMDYAEARGYNVCEAILAKLEFNKTRPHRHGGKKFQYEREVYDCQKAG